MREKVLKPRVFIGSTSEALHLADAVHANLTHYAECVVWKHAFNLAASTLAELMRNLRESDFGVFILSPDDISIMRGSTNPVARDNVIFELGMFIGRLGAERTFFLVPDGSSELRLPSDLAGITAGRYETNRRDNNMLAALNPACMQIRMMMEKLKPFQDVVVALEEQGRSQSAATELKAEDGRNGKITLEAYKNSYLIKGDTIPFKDRFLGWAKWNRALGAWVLPKGKLESFKDEFRDLLGA
jgi:Predicted nucleotide-binding protein containing TIR-like domain